MSFSMASPVPVNSCVSVAPSAMARVSQTRTYLSTPDVTSMFARVVLGETDDAAPWCARKRKTGCAVFRMSYRTTMPSSVELYRYAPMMGSHAMSSASAVSSIAMVFCPGARTSTTHVALSKPAVAMMVGSRLCQARDCTLDAWCVRVSVMACVVTSQSLTVLSAEPEARMCGACMFIARDMTASWWASRLRFALLPLLSLAATALELAPSPPSVATGSMGSSTSRFQISITGSKVPTATKDPPTEPALCGATPHQDRHSGKAGMVMSWCT
mmetsp:Transcript_36338/g.113941  ORF Transcript_36338/g.113941 Transcript_36338/m.113941 type:complete len:271 (-) Transcript_36338:353-1165(-)